MTPAEMWGIAISWLAGFVVATFIYQACTRQEWNVAAKRSFFQVIAVVGVVWVITSRLS